MIEPIVFLFAHAILGIFARFWVTGFDTKKVFVDEKLQTVGWVAGAIILGFVLLFLFPIR